MGEVNQIPRRNFTEFNTQFMLHYQQMIDAVNSVLGYHGTTTLRSDLNLNGNKITGVGTASADSDVVTLGTANSNYSAEALRPQLEANGSTPLQSVRRLNDSTQREQNSSYMNTLMSTAPSANNIEVLFSSPGSGMTSITIPASLFRFADGSTQNLNAFTLTVSDPGTFTITTAVSDGTTATITTTALSGVVAGNYVTITGVSDSDFDGTWLVSGVTGDVFTFATTIAAASATGGSVTTASVYYFYATASSQNVQYIGVASTADTPYNRLPTSTDGRQLIAIATVSGSGGVSAQSAGGGTPSSTLNAGSFF